MKSVHQHNDVAIMLGNGDGNLQPPVFYPVGSHPQYLAIAHLNRDGKQDLAVTNFVGDTVSVLLGNGDGTFQDKVDYETGPTPNQVVVADFDRDGKLDLAIANSADFNLPEGTGSISILLGRGDGTFQGQIDFGADRFSFVTVADFNGDGRLDIFSGLSIFMQGSDEPKVDLSPASLTFGDEDVGSPSLPQTVTLTNTGTSALVISGISFGGTNPTDFTQTNNCGTGVAGGGSCTIQVSFAPTATGPRAAIFQVSDNAPGSPQSVTLSGTGVAPSVALSPTSLTFSTTVLGVTSASQPVTLTNTGTGPLMITSIAAQGEFLQQNNCGTSLAAGLICTITVQFKPLHRDTRTGAVVITDNAADSPQSVELTGVGTVVKLSAIGINFGNQRVGTSKASAVTLTNVRNQPLSITGITIDGTNPGDFSQVNTCGTSVPAHGSCQIKITFTPMTQGSRSATLEISDDGGGSPQSVALAGNGT